MRLSDFIIARPIGSNKDVLKRNIDVTDVLTILSEEGFNSFNEERVLHRIYGHDMGSVRERIRNSALGVPREAHVEIDAYGPDSDFLVIKFNY